MGRCELCDVGDVGLVSCAIGCVRCVEVGSPAANPIKHDANKDAVTVG